MAESWTPAKTRRVAWLGAGIAVAAIIVPSLPALASGLTGTSEPDAAPSAGSAGSAGSASTVSSVVSTYTATLEVVPAGAPVMLGQINQPAAGMAVWVGCGGGRALSGGFALPPDAGEGTVTDTKGSSAGEWSFEHSVRMPVGTKLYAVCTRD